MKKNYTVLAFKPMKTDKTCKVALIDRHYEFCSFVVAWDFRQESMTWGQGHYFVSYDEALEYFNTNY